MPVQAVLFDVDGVLVHPWRFRDWLEREHGITPAMTASFFTGPFHACAVGRADVAEVLPPFLATWGWRGTTEAFLERWQAIEDALNHQVLAVVRALQAAGVPCFVASTQERRRAAYLAGPMGLAERFDGLFFSCDLGVEKPEAAFFAEVTRRLGCPGHALLFIDDQPANVDAARAEGWAAEVFTDVATLRADLSRHTGLAWDADAQ